MRLKGKKQNKDRVTFLLCCNSDGSERLPPLVVGCSARPRCFGGKEGAELGFDYSWAKKGWMTREIFFQWLYRVSSYISETPGRRILLIIDNASSHGQYENIPILNNVTIRF